MQEYEQTGNYDCIVVGGGASGLAAISAMADLGITNTLLLEKNAEAGGSLLTNSEPISLLRFLFHFLFSFSLLFLLPSSI